METLTSSSSSKLFSHKYRETDRGLSCTRDVVLSRPEIRFFQSPKHANVSFSRSITRQHWTIHPIFSLSSSDTQTHTQNEEMQIQDTTQFKIIKSVRVKFQLQRECSFGQQFLLLGDDPVFGLWDPSNAVPLNWSDGHVWSVELDIPIGKLIKFKFILKGGTENILWQPGPDRILQTWETKKTITVCEDWDSPELQRMVEEEPTSNQTEEAIADSEMMMVAENLTLSKESPRTDAEGESSTNNSTKNPKEKPFMDNPLAIIAENITSTEKPQVNASNIVSPGSSITTAKENNVDITDKDMSTGENIFGINGRPVNVKDSTSAKDEDRLVSYEEVPVLVPGLAPLPTVHAEEAPPNEVEKSSATEASLGANMFNDLNVPEFDSKTQPDTESPGQQETTQIVFNYKQEPHDNKEVEKPSLPKEQVPSTMEPLGNSVLENDIQWVRKTLQKLLNNLGFL